jgi:hypothetical protein
VDSSFLNRYNLCAMIDATYIFFSQPGELGAEALRKAKRIYEKGGVDHEWVLAPQGAVTGYAPSEVMLTPSSPIRFRTGMAVAWSPSVGAARSGDTVLLHDNGFEILTPTQHWPTLVVSVKGHEIERPAVLVLEVEGAQPAAEAPAG